MKLSNMRTGISLAGLLCIVSYIKPSNAFFGFGGCPVKYPGVTGPFGTSGKIPNGMYYSQFLDDQYWTFMEDMIVPQLPAAVRPTGSRRFHDCN